MGAAGVREHVRVPAEQLRPVAYADIGAAAPPQQAIQRGLRRGVERAGRLRAAGEPAPCTAFST